MLCYVEIKYSDWLKIVMLIGIANQSALFQLLYKLFMTLARS